MNDNKQFEALIARARSERAPNIDVAGKVIAILSGEEVRFEPASDKPLMWLAAFSSAVAASAAIAAVFVYQTWSDPLYELSQAVA
ncbi:MAG: hypothetical protein ACYS8Z_07005 [Planctomycetota bacterium]|jgi:hypothetical protein